MPTAVASKRRRRGCRCGGACGTAHGGTFPVEARASNTIRTLRLSGKTIRDRRASPRPCKKNCTGICRALPRAPLDLAVAPAEHLSVLVPRTKSGDERGNAEAAQSRQSVAAPATVSGEPRPTRPLGNWEGRIEATTREPGDLPARSPNRWTGRPYGAVFRSGDVNAGAKAVKDRLFHDIRHAERQRVVCVPRTSSFASGLVSPDALALCARAQTKERCVMGKGWNLEVWAGRARRRIGARRIAGAGGARAG